MKAASVLLFLAILFASTAAWAGPPFQTDDPEPIDFKNYEFYTFATADGTPVEMDTAGPAAEFNWGAFPNVHLHIIVPLAAILPSNNPSFAPAGIGPSAIGLGDIETGIKFRFLHETNAEVLPMSSRQPFYGATIEAPKHLQSAAKSKSVRQSSEGANPALNRSRVIDQAIDGSKMCARSDNRIAAAGLQARIGAELRYWCHWHEKSLARRDRTE